MTVTFLVLRANGVCERASADDLHPEDRVMVDSPDSSRSLDAAADALNEEIRMAGGLENWRSQAPSGHS